MNVWLNRISNPIPTPTIMMLSDDCIEVIVSFMLDEMGLDAMSLACTCKRMYNLVYLRKRNRSKLSAYRLSLAKKFPCYSSEGWSIKSKDHGGALSRYSICYLGKEKHSIILSDLHACVSRATLDGFVLVDLRNKTLFVTRVYLNRETTTKVLAVYPGPCVVLESGDVVVAHASAQAACKYRNMLTRFSERDMEKSLSLRLFPCLNGSIVRLKSIDHVVTAWSDDKSEPWHTCMKSLRIFRRPD